MDTNQVVVSFLDAYYKTMMNDRKSLVNFYTESSCMTYTGTEHKGLTQIMEKFNGMSFKSINYKFDNYDVQPSPSNGGLVIFVTGSLVMDGENNFTFAQVFQLLPNQQGGYYLFNDMFRLIY